MQRIFTFSIPFPLLLCLLTFGVHPSVGYGQCGSFSFSTQQEIDDFAANNPGCTEPTNITIDDFAISDLSGLSQITSVGGNLAIAFNDALRDLSGLNNLTSVGGNLTIVFNSSLESLSGLNNLTTVGGNLDIDSNTFLESLSDLNNLNTVGGSLDIYSNFFLESLSGLDNLNTVSGNLSIFDNDNLEDLSGLNNLTSVGGGLFVFDNRSLSDCAIQAVCNALVDPSVSTFIESNASGCDSEAEVQAACVALPVELTSFTATATPSQDAIALDWETAAETANRGFYLERSKDGSRWESLTFVPGQGSGRTRQAYRYLDQQPLSGLNYYRLQQLDLDGTRAYSEIVTATVAGGKGNLRLFPNPSRGALELSLPTALTVPLTVGVYTLSGQSVYQQRIEVDGTRASLSLPDLPNGTYTLTAQQGQQYWRKRLVIVR
ncbi:MAG: T9SS type A sorting domain-containing protein [Bacteroidota bacterium]